MNNEQQPQNSVRVEVDPKEKRARRFESKQEKDKKGDDNEVIENITPQTTPEKKFKKKSTVTRANLTPAELKKEQDKLKEAVNTAKENRLNKFKAPAHLIKSVVPAKPEPKPIVAAEERTDAPLVQQEETNPIRAARNKAQTLGSKKRAHQIFSTDPGTVKLMANARKEKIPYAMSAPKKAAPVPQQEQIKPTETIKAKEPIKIKTPEEKRELYTQDLATIQASIKKAEERRVKSVTQGNTKRSEQMQRRLDELLTQKSQTVELLNRLPKAEKLKEKKLAPTTSKQFMELTPAERAAQMRENAAKYAKKEAERIAAEASREEREKLDTTRAARTYEIPSTPTRATIKSEGLDQTNTKDNMVDGSNQEQSLDSSRARRIVRERKRIGSSKRVQTRAQEDLAVDNSKQNERENDIEAAARNIELQKNIGKMLQEFDVENAIPEPSDAPGEEASTVATEAEPANEEIPVANDIQDDDLELPEPMEKGTIGADEEIPVTDAIQTDQNIEPEPKVATPVEVETVEDEDEPEFIIEDPDEEAPKPEDLPQQVEVSRVIPMEKVSPPATVEKKPRVVDTEKIAAVRERLNTQPVIKEYTTSPVTGLMHLNDLKEYLATAKNVDELTSNYETRKLAYKELTNREKNLRILKEDAKANKLLAERREQNEAGLLIKAKIEELKKQKIIPERLSDLGQVIVGGSIPKAPRSKDPLAASYETLIEDFERLNLERNRVSKNKIELLTSKNLITHSPYKEQYAALEEEEARIRGEYNTIDAQLTSIKNIIESKITEKKSERLSKWWETAKDRYFNLVNSAGNHEEATTTLRNITTNSSTTFLEKTKNIATKSLKWIRSSLINGFFKKSD